MGRSGRLALMLPKEVIVVPGEYEVEIREIKPPEAPVELAATIPEPTPEQKPSKEVQMEVQYGYNVEA